MRAIVYRRLKRFPLPRRPGGEGGVRGADELGCSISHLTLPRRSLSSGRAPRGPVGRGSLPLPPRGGQGAGGEGLIGRCSWVPGPARWAVLE